MPAFSDSAAVDGSPDALIVTIVSWSSTPVVVTANGASPVNVDSSPGITMFVASDPFGSNETVRSMTSPVFSVPVMGHARLMTAAAAAAG